MAGYRGHRGHRVVLRAVRALLVMAVVAAALLISRRDDDPEAAPGSPTPSATTTAATTPSPAPDKVDPETWCEAFLAFADAQSQYVGNPDDPQTQANLEGYGDALLALGQPLGLSAGGVTSLQLLVDGSLEQAGDPTVPPGATPADDQAFAAYLASACPA